ncbi:uncharacterized protein BO72DRAFT_453362 [Aspergillus fijiensis CBS 313.89]|uniref:Uncharacterized protein n=1 Tax=Aspergillus fijiensis CBS 313.89 TaxID=1448319 RepID=A0A8G1VW93_9EURO|nr:uncharacterized protein BO72DRAFT_453362 [Aspergillus fijiensis CBS 313.89]RAK71749.1 hypothetical protein BO72DRAFT_453362 [Aspergillus fijiensis CBS 313.89]
MSPKQDLQPQHHHSHQPSSQLETTPQHTSTAWMSPTATTATQPITHYLPIRWPRQESPPPSHPKM